MPVRKKKVIAPPSTRRVITRRAAATLAAVDVNNTAPAPDPNKSRRTPLREAKKPPHTPTTPDNPSAIKSINTNQASSDALATDSNKSCRTPTREEKKLPVIISKKPTDNIPLAAKEITKIVIIPPPRPLAEPLPSLDPPVINNLNDPPLANMEDIC